MNGREGEIGRIARRENTYNQAVKTQSFGKDKNQDHRDVQFGLLTVGTDTGVTYTAKRYG